jgi:hypothetical protein
MRALLILCAAFVLTAQQSPFPASLDSDGTLGVPADQVSSALTAAMTTTSTTATVANAVNIPVWSLITFGSELMQVCQKSGNVLTFGVAATCPSLTGRGLSGTTIAAHKTGVIGYLNTNSWYHVAQSSAIKAIENSLLGVKGFGAKGDGIADDTAAILAGVSAIQQTHGSLVFPCGNYLFSSEITITSRITLQGGGDGDSSTNSHACTTLTKTASVIGIHVRSGANYTTLKGFRLTSTASTGTADGIVIGDADTTNGAGEVRIENVLVDSQRGNGINVRNGNSGILDHVTANANGAHGVLISSQQTSVNNANAWRVHSSSAFSNGGSGFYFDVAGGTTATGLDTEGNAQHGVYANQPGIQIKGGDAESNTTDDIATGSSCFGCVIEMNNVNNHIVQGSPYSWIVNTSLGTGPYVFHASGSLGIFGGLKVPVAAPAYGPDVTIDNDTGNSFLITVTNNVNFIILAPANPNYSQRISITIRNSSGGAMGTPAFSGYVLGSPWVNPLNGCSRSIDFQINAATGITTEVSRSLSDICASSARSDYEVSNTAPFVQAGLTASGSVAAFTYPNIPVQAIFRTTCHAFNTAAGSAGSAKLFLQTRSLSSASNFPTNNVLDLTVNGSQYSVTDFEIIPPNTSGRSIGVQWIVTGNVGGVFSVECVTDRMQ